MSGDAWTPNPIVHLFAPAVGGFGWQVHGIWVGIAIAISYVVLVLIGNFRITYSIKESDSIIDISKRYHRWKWIVFIGLTIGVMISGTEYHTM